MPLSHDLKRLTGKAMHPDVLAAWVMNNRARLIEALEMDECTVQVSIMDAANLRETALPSAG